MSQPLSRTPLKLDDIFTALQRELESKPYGYISDIYLQQGQPPAFFCAGEFTFPNDSFFREFETLVLTREDLGQIVNECWNKNEEKVDDKKDRASVNDFAFTWTMKDYFGDMKELRVRAHLSSNYSGKSMCLRLLPALVPDIEELNIPIILQELAIKNNTGLIIVSGGTGSGKSTTVASIIKGFCRERKGHIATLEDPVEYVLDYPGRLITQQWVGVHVPSWTAGIRSALRDKVELLMIGELREPDSVRAAIQAASSGHIVLATAHFTECVRVLTYLEDMFAAAERENVRSMLAECLLGVCCQKLLPSEDAGFSKPVPCYELFVNSPAIANNLKKDQSTILPSLMERGEGCVRWDDRLNWLLRQRLITKEVYDLNVRKKE